MPLLFVSGYLLVTGDAGARNWFYVKQTTWVSFCFDYAGSYIFVAHAYRCPVYVHSYPATRLPGYPATRLMKRLRYKAVEQKAL